MESKQTRKEMEKKEKKRIWNKEKMCKWFAGGLPCPEWEYKGTCRNMHNPVIRRLYSTF